MLPHQIYIIHHPSIGSPKFKWQEEEYEDHAIVFSPTIRARLLMAHQQWTNRTVAIAPLPLGMELLQWFCRLLDWQVNTRVSERKTWLSKVYRWLQLLIRPFWSDMFKAVKIVADSTFSSVSLCLIGPLDPNERPNKNLSCHYNSPLDALYFTEKWPTTIVWMVAMLWTFSYTPAHVFYTNVVVVVMLMMVILLVLIKS